MIVISTLINNSLYLTLNSIPIIAPISFVTPYSQSNSNLLLTHCLNFLLIKWKFVHLFGFLEEFTLLFKKHHLISKYQLVFLQYYFKTRFPFIFQFELVIELNFILPRSNLPLIISCHQVTSFITLIIIILILNFVNLLN